MVLVFLPSGCPACDLWLTLSKAIKMKDDQVSRISAHIHNEHCTDLGIKTILFGATSESYLTVSVVFLTVRNM